MHDLSAKLLQNGIHTFFFLLEYNYIAAKFCPYNKLLLFVFRFSGLKWKQNKYL